MVKVFVEPPRGSLACSGSGGEDSGAAPADAKPELRSSAHWLAFRPLQGTLCSPCGRALPELAGAAAVRAMEVLPAGRTWDPLQAPEEAAGHPAGEGDPEPQPDGRTSRTASLVSGLLTELYSCTEEEEVAAGGDRASQGRPPRRDSLDSSTETSGSDVFLGGRGADDSRVLQELRERPSLRLQRQYLQRKGERRRGGLLPICATCPAAPFAPPAPVAHLRHLSPLPTCATCVTALPAHRESMESPFI